MEIYYIHQKHLPPCTLGDCQLILAMPSMLCMKGRASDSLLHRNYVATVHFKSDQIIAQHYI